MGAESNLPDHSEGASDALRAPLAGKSGVSAPLGASVTHSDAGDALARLDRYEERAAVLEYDAGLPRAAAEARAHLEVFGGVGRPGEWGVTR